MPVTNQQVNNAPVQAAHDEAQAPEAAAAANPRPGRLGDFAQDMVRLDAETKQVDENFFEEG